MRVFLTGVASYLGSRVAEELVGEGHELAVLVRDAAEDAAARRLGAWPLHAQLRDTERLRGIVADADAVAHLAAGDGPAPPPVDRAAVDAMLDGLPDGAAFVMVGPALVFGDTGGRAHDGKGPAAPLPFLAERAGFEAALMAHPQAARLRIALVRAALVYGGGAGAPIPALMAGAALRLGRAIGPAGGARWSAVHVLDWARLVVAALRLTPPGAQAFVAGGEPLSLADLAALIGAAAGLGPPVSVPAAEAACVWGPLGPVLFLDQLFAGDAAERALGWVREWNCLAEEIERMVRELTEP